MKKYIFYTLLLIFVANVSYAQKDQKTIEAAKKRLTELRAKKAKIEKEMQEILQPDQVITTEIKDGIRTQTVQTKTPDTLPSPTETLVDQEDKLVVQGATPEINATKTKISRRDKRRQKETENIDIVIEQPEEIIEETAIEIVAETPEIETEVVPETPKTKISRRDKRRQKETGNIDIVIEQPEEIVEETAIEIVAETPKIETEIVPETPKTKISRRDKRRQKETENVDIVIEQPKEIVEETAIEIVAETPEIETEIVPETPKTKISRRDKRRQKETENVDIVIEQPEEIMEETAIEIVAETPEIETEVVPETPKVKISRRDKRRQKETENIDIVIEQPEEIVEETAIEIVAETPEIETEVVPETPKAKISRRDKRRQKETENIDIVIEQPEEIIEETAIEIVAETPEIETEVVPETPKAKISRRDKRRQKETENIDIVIEQPEEIIEETAIEIVAETPEIETEIIPETPKVKISRRDKRRQKETENIDIVIEQPEEIVEETAIEIVAETPEIETEIIPETPKAKISRRDKRRQKETENIDIVIEQPEEIVEETAIEIVAETPEIETEVVPETPKAKISRRDKRRQKETENIDIVIEQPEEIVEETAIEIVAKTPEIETEIVLETPKTKISRRDKRRQKETENFDIVIEQPEEIIEETAIEIVAETPEIETEVVPETPETKISRRDKRRQKETENIDIVIEQPEEIIEETAIEIVAETPEIETEVVPEIPKAKISRRDKRRQKETENFDIVIEQPEEIVEETAIEIVAETPEIETEVVEKVQKSAKVETDNAPKIEVNIQSTGIEIEDTPPIEIAIRVPKVDAPPTEAVELVQETKLSRKERRKLRQTENFDIKIESPEEAPTIELVETQPTESTDNESVTRVKDPEEEAIIAEIETAVSKKAMLSIDVVDMPMTAKSRGVNLSNEASFAMMDILTATPPESVPPEVTFYDAKLKLIVGEMEALASKSALLPSGMKRINDKLSTIESQLLKFDDMKSEPETAKYMNFMQMNIDILQNTTDDPNANSPTGMLMEPKADTPSSAPKGAQKIYFTKDSDAIGYPFEKELEALVATAKDIPALYLIIESMDENQSKSRIAQKRADNIRIFLEEKGLAPQRIRSRYFNNTPEELSAQPAMNILIVDN